MFQKISGYFSVLIGISLIFGLLTIFPSAHAAQKDCKVLNMTTFVDQTGDPGPDRHYLGWAATVRNRTKFAKDFRVYYRILNMTDKTVAGTFVIRGVIPARTTLPLPSSVESVPIGATLKLERLYVSEWLCSTTKEKTYYANVVWPEPTARCGDDQYYNGEHGVAGCPFFSVTNNTTKTLNVNASTIIWFDASNKVVWGTRELYFSSEAVIPPGFSSGLSYFGPGIPGEAVRAEGWITTD